MRTSTIFFAILSSALTTTSVTAQIAVSAWSGSVCDGIEVGSIELDQNPNGLSNPDSTPTALCVHFDKALPADCDVYLCADANCNDQGTTVEGPRDAGTRVENTSFEGMQVGCQLEEQILLFVDLGNMLEVE
ncbi:hypothetical protein GYMLUDRAFT_242822 [Collybiopsis luxurians FD-317 M1]|uniref:Uncharacterized protein n=1 Tax=Collybiopsis luxurians FD-317 M1 TaxID=944289 RepID=A0A0D0C223_9AGAR|nr:hypothetical protein GYMLUDRAFT_242822 [Collybiopsis luxurians FD-317 M1]